MPDTYARRDVLVKLLKLPGAAALYWIGGGLRVFAEGQDGDDDQERKEGFSDRRR